MLELTLLDLVEPSPARAGDRVAVIDGTRRITYAELREETEALAGYLHDHGVRAGDRVGIQLQKSVEEIVATFAIARVGGVAVNVHPHRTAEQLAHIARHTGMKLAFSESRRAQELSTLLGSETPALVTRTDAPEGLGAVSFAALPRSLRAPRPHVIDRALAAIMYTSGSTSDPKGVMLSHANLVIAARSVARHLGNTCEDRVVSVLPMSFIYGLHQLTTMCLVGGALVLQRVSMPVEILRTAASARVTGLPLTPSLWVSVVSCILANPELGRLPDLRYVTSSGGPLPKATLEAMLDIFSKKEIFTLYGSTEAFRATYVPPERLPEKLGALGIPCPNTEVFVVDAERGECGAGEPGELVQRGASVAMGYFRDPEGTAARFGPCPALREKLGSETVYFSGDMVVRDRDGYLWFRGRNDTMFKSNGFRISPAEIESVAMASGMTSEAVAFGVPDEQLGNRVHLAVSMEGPPAPLLAHLRAHLPPYAVPAHLHASAAPLPRTPHGKIDREAVRKAHAELEQGVSA